MLHLAPNQGKSATGTLPLGDRGDLAQLVAGIVVHRDRLITTDRPKIAAISHRWSRAFLSLTSAPAHCCYAIRLQLIRVAKSPATSCSGYQFTNYRAIMLASVPSASYGLAAVENSVGFQSHGFRIPSAPCRIGI